MKINFLFVYRFFRFHLSHSQTEPRSERKQQSNDFALIQIGLSTTDQRKMVNNSQHLYFALCYSIDHSAKTF